GKGFIHMATDPIYQFAGICIDSTRNVATVDGRELDLTSAEFRLLEHLLRHPGQAFSRPQLMQAIGEEIILERTIDVLIKTLRDKLGAEKNVIETVPGIGFRLGDAKA